MSEDKIKAAEVVKKGAEYVPTLTVNEVHSDELTTLDRTFTNTPDLQSAYDVPSTTIEIDPLAVDIDLAKVMPLVIQDKGVDLFVIQPNGAVYVRGELVTDDADIVQGLRDAVKEMTS